ncbi:hypothetical protein EJD97_016069, partial [Solanum chilense]
MELIGATTIKRDRVVNEVVIFYGVGAGVGVGVAASVAAAAGAGQDKGTTSCRRCCGFLYEKCKKHNEDSIMYLQTLSQRHVTYSNYYDPRDRILDLNFYTNFQKIYNEMSDEATTVGGRNIKQLVDEFVRDEDMIDYVRGTRPYPVGMYWIDAKRILTVMNMDNIHFVTLEILLHEGRMNVYDCNLMFTEHAKFLTYIQHVFGLLPKLL